jgi:hypothetical protein
MKYILIAVAMMSAAFAMPAMAEGYEGFSEVPPYAVDSADVGGVVVASSTCTQSNPCSTAGQGNLEPHKVTTCLQWPDGSGAPNIAFAGPYEVGWRS